MWVARPLSYFIPHSTECFRFRPGRKSAEGAFFRFRPGRKSAEGVFSVFRPGRKLAEGVFSVFRPVRKTNSWSVRLPTTAR